ncbi:MAG: hypothetical protein P1U53_16455, partial [Sulfitobacter sp.]|nr:hypothetical protein [Sulfitobacter sp.]
CVLPQFLGICALTYFFQNPDVGTHFFAADNKVVDANSLSAMPVFLGQILPSGIIGVVGAGMLAAFMSTHDTYLLCWASVLVEDVVAPICDGNLTQKNRLWLTRLFLVLIAGFLLIWSMWYELGQDLWDYMAVSGAIYFTGAFAILLGGIYWKRASAAGAWIALLCGTSAVLGLDAVQSGLGLTEMFTDLGIGGPEVGLGAVALSVIGLFLGSLLFPDPEGPAAPTTTSDPIAS